MQTVLITGAASGIGMATAQQAARQGWRCVLVDRDGEGLAALCCALKPSSQGDHLAYALDLTEGEAVKALRDVVPPLDALINNAGMSDSRNLPLVEHAAEDIDALLELNLHVPATLIQRLADHLKTGARIVNVASGAGLRSIPWRGMYSPSKAGLIAQSQALAQARPDWCVSVLSPGFVRTALVEGLMRTGRLNVEGALAKIPLGRMADQEEMARALCFLASPDAVPLSGQVLVVDGGSSIYGGSQTLPAATLALLPLDGPLQLTVCGDVGAPWLAAAAMLEPNVTMAGYRACIDLSPLSCGSANVLQAVHAAAVRFAQSHTQQASLTVLLPCPAHEHWQDAGGVAAARMLVSTLACEWGSRALRINAVECLPGPPSQALLPLLRYVAGAGAQYLTGQTLHCRNIA